MLSFLVMKLDHDITVYQFRNMSVSCYELLQWTSECFPPTSIVINRPQIINGIVGRCIHQQGTCVSHRVLNDECLVQNNGSWTCPDNVTEPSESPLPNPFNQVEAGREKYTKGLHVYSNIRIGENDKFGHVCVCFDTERQDST